MASVPVAVVLLLLVLGLEFEPSSGDPEVTALMEMKAALDPEDRFLSSWTGDGDPCRGDFEGVACNEHGKVANISLQGKGLSGSISPAVAALKCLSGLYLHYNALTGKIPREIGNLTELTDLYLNVNNLSGSIPVELGNMSSLQGEFLPAASSSSFLKKTIKIQETNQMERLSRFCCMHAITILNNSNS